MRIGFLLVAATVLAAHGPVRAQDIAAGEKSFNKCRACHQVGETAKSVAGPKLNGLFGRKAGSIAEFKYSEANKNSGVTWDEAYFAKYIKDPKAAIPGTKMVFPGIKDDAEIANLTAFLKQFDADGKRK
ncbi:MAG: cytochrome c family protein [Rhodospirillales bacterium]|nr:cytochrome c family protein [Rhodospirillales bacterium]